MTTNDLISAVAKKAAETTGENVTKKAVKEVMDALKAVVYETVATEDVKLFDSLTLSAVYKEARTCRNPLTGEPVYVPGKYAPKAKFGKAYKDALNSGIEE